MDILDNTTTDPVGWRRLITNQIDACFHKIHLAPRRNVSRGHRGPVSALDVESVEGRYMLSAGADANINIYDLDSSSSSSSSSNTSNNNNNIKSVALIEKNYGHQYAVTDIHWYPFDTGMFTSSSTDKTVKVWDTNRLQAAFTFDLDNRVYSHHMSPISTSHSLIACALESPHIRLCDLRSGAKTHMLVGHRGPVLIVRWSPRHEYLLASGGDDGGVRIWDVRKAKSCLAVLDQHDARGSSNNNSNNNSSSSSRKRRRGYGDDDGDGDDQDTSRNHTAVTTAHSGPVNGAVFSADGSYLITTSHDGRIRCWDTMDFTNTMVNFGPPISNRLYSPVYMATTPLDCRQSEYLFYPTDDREVMIYDVHTGQTTATLRGHFARVGCVAMRCARSKMVYEVFSGGNDCEILCWRSEKYEEWERLEENGRSNSDSSSNNDSRRSRGGRRRREQQVQVAQDVTQDAWSDDDD